MRASQVTWNPDGTRGSVYLIPLKLIVFRDGDRPEMWWGSVDVDVGNDSSVMWWSPPGGPFESKEKAQEAVEAELRRRLALIVEAVSGWESA